MRFIGTLLVIAVVGILWITFHDAYVHTQQQKAVAAQIDADCITHPPTDDVGRFLCGPLGRPGHVVGDAADVGD
jgi:hypothetical protein